MTNDDAAFFDRQIERENALLQMGYSSKDIAEMRHHESRPNMFSNALAFIVEALADENVQNTDDILNLDEGSFWEFSMIWNFDKESLDKAMIAFRIAVTQEITNAHWSGECRNCMEHPPAFN